MKFHANEKFEGEKKNEISGKTQKKTHCPKMKIDFALELPFGTLDH